MQSPLKTAYDSYVRYCQTIGQTPQKPEDWQDTSSKAKSNVGAQSIIWNVR